MKSRSPDNLILSGSVGSSANLSEHPAAYHNVSGNNFIRIDNCGIFNYHSHKFTTTAFPYSVT